MESISIKNYKNLNNFCIKKFERINLFVGKNNVGKSSLIEAIYLFATKGDIHQINELLTWRGESLAYRVQEEQVLEDNIAALSSLYSNFDTESFFNDPIVIKENDNECLTIKLSHTPRISRHLEFEPDSTQENVPLFPNSLSVSINNSVDPVNYFLDRGIMRYASSKTAQTPCGYVPLNLTEIRDLPELFDDIALSHLSPLVVEALRIINPHIKEINFLTDRNRRSSRRVAFVLNENSEQRVKLSSMGDGVNRILAIILTMVNCKNGIFLIDEFDSGLHYSVQRKLWEMIFNVAEKLHIQVFATTHSDDCVRSFSAIARHQKGSIIRLQERRGEIIATSYDDADELDYIATSDTEVR